jgi:hypothetical protein
MKSMMLVIAVVAGLIGGLLGSFGTNSRSVSADSPPTKITASEVDVVDGAGNTLIRLYSDKGAPAIAMQTAAGTAVLAIAGIKLQQTTDPSNKTVTLGPSNLTFTKDGKVYAAYPRY